jgi:signal transduction histidine kinase
MAIVKSVVEAHGGTIFVHSEVGVGTSIEISIPAIAV